MLPGASPRCTMWQSSRAAIALQEDFRMLQEVSTGAYYPPVVTVGRFLLPEHPTGQRGHCALVGGKKYTNLKLPQGDKGIEVDKFNYFFVHKYLQ